MIASNPQSSRLHGACSREDPEPKLGPVTSTEAEAYSGLFRTKVGSRFPSAVRRQSQNRNSPYPVRSIRLRNCLGMIWSVSMFARGKGAMVPDTRSMERISTLPRAHIDKPAGDGGGGSHLRADQVSSPVFSLPPFEIPV